MNASEIVERAREIYESQLRANVEPGNHGRYIVIDINSADYAVGDDYVDLTDDLRSRHTDPLLATLRIGYRAVGKVGGQVRPA